jgi:hypothetical protein
MLDMVANCKVEILQAFLIECLQNDTALGAVRIRG